MAFATIASDGICDNGICNDDICDDGMTLASDGIWDDGICDDGICDYSIRWHLRQWHLRRCHLILSASDQTQSKQTIEWNVLLQIFLWTITSCLIQWLNTILPNHGLKRIGYTSVINPVFCYCTLSCALRQGTKRPHHERKLSPGHDQVDKLLFHSA